MIPVSNYEKIDNVFNFFDTIISIVPTDRQKWYDNVADAR